MTGILVLAAGESKRFGSPKQLALYGGKPLLRHVAETAVHANIGPVSVVLGAIDAPCREVLQGLDVNVVYHPEWQKGLGGSIAAGLQPWANPASGVEGLIVILGDQPRVTPEHLRALEAASANFQIVASHYNGQPGVPAWFSRHHFPALLQLHGPQGAKSLLHNEPDIHHIRCPDAALDIDFPADLP